MKFFISVDMEGISGVATNMQLKKDSEYNRFRMLMTADANAAIAGAFDAGATEVVVADGHGNRFLKGFLLSVRRKEQFRFV